MNIFAVALLVYAALLVFYVLYIAAINIYSDWEYLAWWVQAIVWTPVVVMVMVDIAMQLTLITLLFWDWPKESMVTKRLARYRRGPDGWRKSVAVAICEKMLNPFDVKGHC